MGKHGLLLSAREPALNSDPHYLLARPPAGEEVLEEGEEEHSVASSKLVRPEKAPGTSAPQSVWGVRARARYQVEKEKRFVPWQSGLRKKRVEGRIKRLIESSAREWKPYGAENCGMEPKMESLMTGFLYPAENEKDE